MQETTGTPMPPQYIAPGSGTAGSARGGVRGGTQGYNYEPVRGNGTFNGAVADW